MSSTNLRTLFEVSTTDSTNCGTNFDFLSGIGGSTRLSTNISTTCGTYSILRSETLNFLSLMDAIL